MFHQLIAIFKNTFLESIRQPIYLILIVIGIIGLILNLNFSAFTMDDDNKFLIDMGMATIFFMGLLIAAFTSTSVITQEIENRTVLTVVSKPVGRPLFIVSKFLGVAVAVLVGVVILTCGFMITVRHGVLQTASDHVDYPTVVLGLGAFLVSVGIGMAGNYLYGWVFSSTTVGALFPLSIVAYIAVMAVNKDWQFQLFAEGSRYGISPDLRPEFILAAYGISLALLVMCAIAIAISTRFGQVMTLFSCLMIFMLGLLTDHFFGQRAYHPQTLARISTVEPGRDMDENFSDENDWYRVVLDTVIDFKRFQKEQEIAEQDPTPVYWAADALGRSFLADCTPEQNRNGEFTRGMIIRKLDGQRAEIVNIGGVESVRKPKAGDYLHASEPDINLGWRILWGIPPNLQSMVLSDTIAQRHDIPLAYLVQITGYAFLYMLSALSLAVILFQKREVG